MNGMLRALSQEYESNECEQGTLPYLGIYGKVVAVDEAAAYDARAECTRNHNEYGQERQDAPQKWRVYNA